MKMIFTYKISYKGVISVEILCYIIENIANSWARPTFFTFLHFFIPFVPAEKIRSEKMYIYFRYLN